jgi:hypothetical protein
MLDVDDRKGRARLADAERKLDQVVMDIDAVVDMVAREHERLFARPFDAQLFLTKLYSAYRALLKGEDKGDSGSVSIRQIAEEIAKVERGFKSDEFVVDLSRLLDAGSVDVDGKRLDLQQTKDTKQGMLLHGTARRGYVGFLTFREVTA